MEEVVENPSPLAGSNLTMAQIKDIVAKYYHITVTDIEGSGRARVFARPRQVAIHFIRLAGKWSLPQIGMQFGGRDHSTVIHACKTVKRLKETDSNFEESIRALTKLLESATPDEGRCCPYCGAASS